MYCFTESDVVDDIHQNKVATHSLPHFFDTTNNFITFSRALHDIETTVRSKIEHMDDLVLHWPNRFLCVEGGIDGVILHKCGQGFM